MAPQTRTMTKKNSKAKATESFETKKMTTIIISKKRSAESRNEPRRTKFNKEEKETLLKHVFVHDVLNIVVENKWLTAREFCQLEATCTDLQNWIETNKVWEKLCQNRWPNTRLIPQAFVTSGGGYKQMYRRRLLSFPSQKFCHYEFSRPTLELDQFGLLVDVSIMGKPAVSLYLSGEELARGNFLSRGEFVGTIPEPFVVGKSQCWINEDDNKKADTEGCQCTKNNNPCLFDSEEYHARIHLLRTGDEFASRCVFSKKGILWEETTCDLPKNDDGIFDLKKSAGKCISNLRFGNSEAFFQDEKDFLIFRNTVAGKEIERLLNGRRLVFDFELRISVIEPGDKIAFTGFKIDALNYDPTGEDWTYKFDDAYFFTLGFSMYHVLEQIQGLK